jgi:hypothetical protein
MTVIDNIKQQKNHDVPWGGGQDKTQTDMDAAVLYGGGFARPRMSASTGRRSPLCRRDELSIGRRQAWNYRGSLGK